MFFFFFFRSFAGLFSLAALACRDSTSCGNWIWYVLCVSLCALTAHAPLHQGRYSWREIRTTGSVPSGRASPSCVVLGDSMVLYGGYDGARCNDCYQLDFGALISVRRAFNSLQKRFDGAPFRLLAACHI